MKKLICKLFKHKMNRRGSYGHYRFLWHCLRCKKVFTKLDVYKNINKIKFIEKGD